MTGKYHNLPSSPTFVAMLTMLATTMVLIYYSSPLHSRFEDVLYDLRARMNLRQLRAEHVVVINVGQAEASGNAELPTQPDRLFAAVRAAKRSEAAKIVVLLNPPYRDADLRQLADLVASEPRALLGLRDVRQGRIFPRSLPPSLQEKVSRRVVNADLQNYYHGHIVRSLPIIKHDEAGNSLFLLANLAQATDRNAVDHLFGDNLIQHDIGDQHSLHMRLNYLPPDSVPILINTDLSTHLDILRDKIVIIADTQYHATAATKPIPVFANTPWQREGADLRKGVANAVVLAIGSENIARNNWLRAAPDYWRWSQTIIISAISVAVWLWPTSWAVITWLMTWFILLLAHGALFAWPNLYIPLTDTLLFSCLATIAGSLWRLGYEGRLRAEIIAEAAANRDVHELQDQFLRDFATELNRLNQSLRRDLNKLSRTFPEGSLAAQAHHKATNTSEDLDDFLQAIQQFAVINDVDQDKLRARKEPVRIRSLVERILSRFERRIHEFQLNINIDIDKNMIIFSDELILDQVLHNLLSNATKYVAQDGLIHIYVLTGNDKISLCISDNGPGIAEEEIDKIFAKFYRIQNEQLYRAKGHGLGLFLSKYFADILGATITVESQLGKGATFCLGLPELK